MVGIENTTDKEGFFRRITRKVWGITGRLFGRSPESPDLHDKIILLDNDELLLVWEKELREIRIQKEEEAWVYFENEYGSGNPKVTEEFLKWQEKLYEHIEKEKDRFLKERQGSKEALDKLLSSGATTIVVTKGAKPYTQKCFNLTGLSPLIKDIYSPAPGRRDKRFADAAHDYGKKNPWLCFKDTVVVGHDLDKDMAWDLVPAREGDNDGKAPVFVLFDTLAFEKDVDAPLDALPEIIDVLAKKGENNILDGFKNLYKKQKASTKNYSFKLALYHTPKRKDKTRIPVIFDIKRRA